METLKAFGGWLYRWATVIAAVVVVGASTLFELFDTLSLYGVDLTKLLPADYAGKIVLGIAVIKAVAHVASTQKETP